MAIALVVNASGSPTTSAADTSGATLIVLALAGAGSATPTDSKSNSWTPLTSQPSGFGSQIQLWYSVAPTVGSGHTFTDNDTTPGTAMAAFSGTSVSSPFDQQNGAVISDPGQPGSVTPSENNELIVSGLGTLSTSTPSIDSGFTITDSILLAGGVTFSTALAYLIQTSASAVNPTWSNFTPFQANAAVIATFKAAATTNTDTTWMGRPDRPMANFFPTIVHVP